MVVSSLVHVLCEGSPLTTSKRWCVRSNVYVRGCKSGGGTLCEQENVETLKPSNFVS